MNGLLTWTQVGLFLLSGLLVAILMLVARTREKLSQLGEGKLTVERRLELQDEMVGELKEKLMLTENTLEEMREGKYCFERASIKAQTQVSGLQQRVDEWEQQIKVLTQKVTLEENNREQLVSENARLQSEANIFQERSQQLQKNIDEVNRILDDTRNDNRLWNKRFTGLSSDYAKLETEHNEKLKHFEEQKKNFERSKQQLSLEFQNLANKIIDEKGRTFNQASESSLDAMLKPFKQQIEGFQKRVNEVHSESIRGQANIEAEIKKVLDIGVKMSDEANSLTSALKGDKKTAGNWGEVQLERTLQLAGLVKGEHYTSQQDLKNDQGKSNRPDFIIQLPDEKHIIIDSKVSLVAYEQAISSDTETGLQKALNQHIIDVKNHINDLNRKDYANLIGVHSPSFVLMFMPIEAAYIEAMKHNKELFNFGYQKNVILVSHTTLMPILKTVANLWRLEKGNREALQISEKAGDIFNQVCVVAERLAKLGQSLNATSNHYNNTVKGLVGQQGLYGKVERFKTLSSKATKQMPSLESNHSDIEIEKLRAIAVKEDNALSAIEVLDKEQNT